MDKRYFDRNLIDFHWCRAAFYRWGCCKCMVALASLQYHFISLYRLALTLFWFVFTSESNFGSNISGIFMFFYFDILLVSYTRGVLSWQPNYDSGPAEMKREQMSRWRRKMILNICSRCIYASFSSNYLFICLKVFHISYNLWFSPAVPGGS